MTLLKPLIISRNLSRIWTMIIFFMIKKTTYAVVRGLEIIGEASKNIPKDIKENYPDIPWKEIAGMRDKIAHEYFGVDLKIVWQTIQEDLPFYEKTINRIKKDLF